MAIEAGVLMLAAASGSAAQAVAPTLQGGVPWMVGPVALYPSISLRDVGFDSNINDDSQNPIGDFTATTQPRLRASLGVGPTQLTGSITIGLVYYATAKEQQSVNRHYEVRYEGTTSRLRPFVAASFNHTSQRTGYEIDAHLPQIDTSLSAGAEFKITPVTSITGSYRRTTQEYLDTAEFLGTALAQQLNYTSDIASAGTRLALTPLTTVSVDIDLQRDRFDQSPLRDANSVRVLPAAEFSPDAIITGRLALGFRQFRPLDARVVPFQGLVGSARITGSLLDGPQLSFDGVRDVNYSYDPATPYYLVLSGHLTVTQRVGGPFDLIGQAGADRLNYVAIEGLPSPGRVDLTRIVGGGVGLRVSPALRVAVVYDVTTRRSTEINNRAYDRRRLFASVTYGL